jgi:hypothetical protein
LANILLDEFYQSLRHCDETLLQIQSQAMIDGKLPADKVLYPLKKEV